MVLEEEILPFFDWLTLNLPAFLFVMFAVGVLGLFLGYLASAMRHGPLEGFKLLMGTLLSGINDLAHLSPRRVMAVARLSFQESIRRRVVLAVFTVFVVVLLFAGWFLDPGSDHPARLYLSFVLTSTNYPVLLLAIFLSAFSLPNDIKNRTIYTIVTKPVRAWEIVVGRMVGFCTIGTLLLALMCLFSFVFVKRGLRHTHYVDPQELVSETIQGDAASWTQQRGLSSLAREHRHEVVTRDGEVVVTSTHDHTHEVVGKPTDEGSDHYRLGSSRGLLLARVPVRGSLEFLDSSGLPGSEGTNVGYEFKYRKYIEGGTLAAAVWTFEGIREEDFPNGLPLEMTLRVFRTYKGIIEKGITGTIQLVRPVPAGSSEAMRSVEFTFTARDHSVYERFLPRKIKATNARGEQKTVDIFEDLVDPETGSLEVWIRCLDRGQYLGMAPADLYLRASNRPFWMNFIKGYLSIWFQMVVVTCLGVTFSTFLSGPVAMMATLAAFVMGFFKSFVFKIASGDLPGGGPVESLVRLVNQSGQMVELDPTLSTWIIQRIDDVLMSVIQAVSYAMPNCGDFNTSRFVAYGFDIPSSLMAQHLVITGAYAVVVSAIGYFCFKTREIAA